MTRSEKLYVGPQFRRLRRELGLTQAAMAEALDVSASYVNLIEHGQRALSATVLLRLSEVFGIDPKTFAARGASEARERIAAALKDPLFKSLDLDREEIVDLTLGSPGMAEAFTTLYAAYAEAQLALADRRGRVDLASDPLEEARRFLSARRNHFPAIEDAAEAIAGTAGHTSGLADYLSSAHGYGLRYLPSDAMAGAVRRLDRHRRELVIADTLDAAGRAFQLALQIAYLGLDRKLDAAVNEARFSGDQARRIARRAVANYAAAAILMPYDRFYRAVEARRYDIEAVARHFGVSFEQCAHRMTTLQRRGFEGIPFFFLRVDQAGNVSKRLDGGGFPFARHGGSCPLWKVHDAFRRPREVLTQVVELPDGARFFSIARTVTAGGGRFGATRVDRAVALGCRLEDAGRTVYAEGIDPEAAPATPIGVTCRLCHRNHCAARAHPPIGRALMADDYRRMAAPYGFAQD